MQELSVTGTVEKRGSKRKPRDDDGIKAVTRQVLVAKGGNTNWLLPLTKDMNLADHN